MIQESDVEQWLAIWKEAGLKINPTQTLDPHGLYPDLPEECQQVGRATYGSTFTTCRRRPAMCGRREPQQHQIRRAASLRAGKFHQRS
jgi:hypothetical protein